MRCFGRQCRGMGKVFVTLVRQTEAQLLELGAEVLPLVQTAQACLHRAPPLSAEQQRRLETQLMAALEAHRRIEHQSRRLTQGKALAHCKIVNAYDPTIAPICKGKSNCPTQFGRKPGIIAEPAAGFIFAWHLPVGNPSDASYVEPLIDKVEQAMAWVGRRPAPTIHSLAGDLAFNDPALRETLHERGILTVGIPRTVEPLPPWPTPEDICRSLEEADLHHIRTPTQVQLAYACGYSRPVVESIIASLLCRGAGRLTYKGHRGAIVQMGMAVMAHNAATLVRMHEYQLSKRARLFRRRLRLRCRKVSQYNASIN
jgi:Transposase DDE domain